jgi:hypothetical protein
MLTSLSKVRLPGMTSTISISFVVLLVVIAELSLPDAVVIASLQTAVQCVWKTGRRPDPVQVFFSMASVVLSAALASLSQLGGDFRAKRLWRRANLFACNRRSPESRVV